MDPIGHPTATDRVTSDAAARLRSTLVVAGLDLARRSDHSALVLLDVEPDRLTVSAALRLPQAAERPTAGCGPPHRPQDLQARTVLAFASR